MEWIDVKTEPPLHEGDMLCVHEGWDDMSFHVIGYREEGKWYNHDGDEIEVTHWMSLPKLPE